MCPPPSPTHNLKAACACIWLHMHARQKKIFTRARQNRRACPHAHVRACAFGRSSCCLRRERVLCKFVAIFFFDSGGVPPQHRGTGARRRGGFVRRTSRALRAKIWIGFQLHVTPGIPVYKAEARVHHISRAEPCTQCFGPRDSGASKAWGSGSGAWRSLWLKLGFSIAMPKVCSGF